VSDAEEQHVEIRGTPAEVWAFLWDADALGRVLPGCESLTAEVPGRYAAVLKYPTPFLTVRADATAELHGPVEPSSVLLVLDGRARGIGGTFHVRIPLTLATVPDAAASADPRTRVGYSVDVRATGALASFGTGMLRDAIADQVEGLASDIGAEIRAGRVPPSAAT
jgi:2-furoyl-CoA dehydrogenase large subunit